MVQQRFSLTLICVSLFVFVSDCIVGLLSVDCLPCCSITLIYVLSLLCLSFHTSPSPETILPSLFPSFSLPSILQFSLLSLSHILFRSLSFPPIGNCTIDVVAVFLPVLLMKVS